ncbi:hypothetical protein ACOZE3_01520 [Streptomyces cinereoruber]|uniref:hypothetical protein n=1 Tax=Streptomyces cinereoruber TaxID=67260 RepID=UPI003BF5D7A4
MDPITAAALAALAGGLGGEAGRHVWQGLATLVRRPFRRGEGQEPAEVPGISSGEPELAAPEQAPEDPARAQELATTLGVRAALDPEFRGLLEEWWQRAREVEPEDRVHNSISGGTQQQVFQGRDFSGLTFTVQRSSSPTD